MTTIDVPALALNAVLNPRTVPRVALTIDEAATALAEAAGEGAVRWLDRMRAKKVRGVQVDVIADCVQEDLRLSGLTGGHDHHGLDRGAAPRGRRLPRRRQRRRDIRTATGREAKQDGEHEDSRQSAIHCTTADGNRSRIRRGTSASIETRPSVET